YNPNLKLPLVPLSDGAGKVIKAGDKVTRFKEGDLVSSTFFQDWCSGQISQAAAGSALGGEIGGVLQAERIFPEHGLVKAPAGYTAEQAATLPCAA
ncbi:MAG TPA: alcohol dehydrogenase catalytic domain-containing protein, partial [Candidatus Melainabacteria bacterium]|nr:alcohol dehydrogenase catalytic domain-containing protein [Candidatus Melainabacteria bacterium]